MMFHVHLDKFEIRLCVVSFIISYATNSETLMIWSRSGIIIFGIIIIYRTRAEGKDLK